MIHCFRGLQNNSWWICITCRITFTAFEPMETSCSRKKGRFHQSPLDFIGADIYRSDAWSPGEINRGFFGIRVGNIAFSADGSTKGQIRMTPLFAFVLALPPRNSRIRGVSPIPPAARHFHFIPHARGTRQPPYITRRYLRKRLC